MNTEVQEIDSNSFGVELYSKTFHSIFPFSLNPIPDKINTFQCLKDIRAFNRRMRLKEFFVDSENRERPPEWMKESKNSTFSPPKNRETNLDSYLDIVNGDTLKLLNINSDSEWSNLTNHQKIKHCTREEDSCFDKGNHKRAKDV